MTKRLILEIPDLGLGDHLFHSHIPRIAKETKRFDEVYISQHSRFRNDDNRRIVWEMNPYVDGFSDLQGVTCDLAKQVKKVSLEMSNGNKPLNNLLDEVMLDYGLDDGKRWHEPEVYYKPKFVSDYNKIILDPNFYSYVGDINKDDVFAHFKKNKIHLDAIMRIRNSKALYKKRNKEDVFIETPALDDFCDLIFSASQLFCFTSGTATLASAINKPAVVFFGKGQGSGFQHSKLHTYQLIELSFKTQILNLLKSPYRFIRYKLIRPQCVLFSGRP